MAQASDSVSPVVLQRWSGERMGQLEKNASSVDAGTAASLLHLPPLADVAAATGAASTTGASSSTSARPDETADVVVEDLSMVRR